MTLLAAPALPLHAAGKYVAGAYVVLVVMLLIYLGIMTLRAGRTRRELSALRRELSERRAEDELDAPRQPTGTRSGAPRAADRHPEAEREVAL